MASRRVIWRGIAGAHLLLASSLHAQGVATVPLDDPVYRAIGRLAALGLVDTALVGQRPYSRREIRRIVTSARRGVGRDGLPLPASARETLDRLGARFDRDPNIAPAPTLGSVLRPTRLQLGGSVTSSEPRLVPSDSGIGGIDAVIDPLTLPHSPPPRYGVPGRATLDVASLHELALGSHLAIAAEPVLRLTERRTLSDRSGISVARLSARWREGNFAALAGREPLEWGQSSRRAVLLSANAPALDMLWLGTDAPIVLPGPLRLAGPSALSFFVADLGAAQRFPHTRLVGYKWSLAPRRDLELGVGVLDFVGGDGAPATTFGKTVRNLFLFPFLPTEGNEFSNTMVGLDARLRLPALSHTEIYWELNADDFDFQRVRSSLWTDDAAQLLGVHLPALGRDGRLEATLELHHTGTRFGRHLQFESGATLERRLLVDPLGPDADGGYLDVGWEGSDGARVGMELAAEVYRGNQHVITTPPFSIHLAATRAQERRHRAVFSLRRGGFIGAQTLIELGVEQVRDAAFVADASRVAALARVRLTYLFR